MTVAGILKPRRFDLAAVLHVVLLVLSLSASAEPPKASSLFPAGGGRGQSVEIVAAGSFENWPVSHWLSEPGLELQPGSEKGKFTVQVAPDAVPGLRWLRLYDAGGATDLLPFEVGTLPSVSEHEPNNEPAKAQAVELFPCIVDGRFEKRNDVDGFAVRLEAGQTLVASLKGQRLGAPMDAVLQVASPEGFVLAQAEDSYGLDPQLVYEAPETATCVVRCFAFPAEPDSRIGFAGGDDFQYRLALTAGPFLDRTFPLAASAEVTEVEGFGWNLPEDARRLAVIPAAATGSVRAWHPAVAGLVEIPLLPNPSIMEQDDDGQMMTVPAAFSGAIEQEGDRDAYRVTWTRGETWRLRVVADEIGSPLDPVLRVLNASGNVLAEEDDTDRGSRDAELTFEVPEDGEYHVSIHDLVGAGGSRFVYRLDVTSPAPDFKLSLSEGRVTVAAAAAAELKVTVERLDGFDQPVELSLLGLPEGLECAAVRNEAAAEPAEKPKRRRRDEKTPENTSTLTITAREGAAAFSGPVSVIGRVEQEGEVLERRAAFPLAVPGRTSDQLWLTVIPAVP